MSVGVPTTLKGGQLAKPASYPPLSFRVGSYLSSQTRWYRTLNSAWYSYPFIHGCATW